MNSEILNLYVQNRKLSYENYKYVIVNEGGLIGENATKFVNKYSRFKSSIAVSLTHRTVNAKSIIAMLYLGVMQFYYIEITICGVDEEIAQDVIKIT